MEEYLYDNPGIVIGLLLILLGIAAGCRPKSISIFHYMSPERRKNVDLHGLGIHVMTGLILLGIVVAGLDVLIRQEEIQFFARIVVVIVGMLILLGTAQRYDHNE